VSSFACVQIYTGLSICIENVHTLHHQTSPARDLFVVYRRVLSNKDDCFIESTANTKLPPPPPFPTYLTNSILLIILPQMEMEPMLQEERTLVTGKQQNAEDATMARL